MMKKRLQTLSLVVVLFSFMLSVFSINADAKGSISYERAKEIIEKKVPNAVIGELELDKEDGVRCYEATLYKNNKTYDIQVKASDGSILMYEWEKESSSCSKQNQKNIGKKKAKKIAKRKVSGSKLVKNYLTSDDGIAIYKVKLQKTKKNYFLEIDAKTGEILQYKWKERAKKKDSDVTNAKQSKYIGKPKAEVIALEKVPGAIVVKSKFDYDDGKAVYEMELIKNQIKYELTIDAVTGKIIEFEVDD